jgi:PBP1b-binding outer membrane lipoprotein LpoB
MLYAFFSVASLILVWRIRPNAVTNLHQVDDAPLHHVAMPDSMSSSPLVAALDPRVDEQMVQEQMVQDPVVDEFEPQSEPKP